MQNKSSKKVILYNLTIDDYSFAKSIGNNLE